MLYRWKHEARGGNHEWLLKRNCALSPRQSALWFISLAAVSLSVALMFASLGAWLVVPFAVLEVAGLFAAFYWFSRHAADYEKVRVGRGRVEVETAVGPRLTRVGHQADWVRVEYGGAPDDLIQLRFAGRQAERERLSIGRFVPSTSRRLLAGEIKQALGAAVV